MNLRKFKLLRVNRSLLAGLFRHDGTRLLKSKGMPDDAVIIGIYEYVAFNADEIIFKVVSESFPEVPPGHKAEYFDVEFSFIDVKKALDFDTYQG